MRVHKSSKFILFASILIFLVWMPILSFWFNNVDLSYMHTYFDIIDPLRSINLIGIIRGHVIFHLPIYLVFGHNSLYYYLFALIFHLVNTVLIYKISLFHTNNNKISLILSLLFGVSIVYSNVLFEGSFNLYYPVLLALLLYSHLYVMVSKKTDIRFIFFINIIFIIGLLVRETILLLPIVYSLSVIFFKPRKEIKSSLLKVLIPMIVIFSIYMLLRFFVLGDLKSDLTDDAVQFRSSLISGGRWLELGMVILVNFFRITSEQIIAYPILYKIKEKLVSFLYLDTSGQQNIALIFPAIVGIVICIVLLAILWKLIKDKKLFRLGLFGLAWMFITNLFIAAILPFPAHVLSQPYTYSTVLSRYNYYGFVGITLFLGAATLKYKKMLPILVVAIIFNFFAIRQASFVLQSKVHNPARSFFTQVKNRYPTFPEKTVIYYNFFQTDRLKDFIGDLTYVFAKKDYPNTEFVLETTLSHIQSEIKSGNYEINQIFSFDMDSDSNLLDKTQQVRDVLVSNNSNIASKPMKVHLQGFVAKQNSDQCEQYLSSYLTKRQASKSSVKVISSTNYGDYPRFYFISPESLNDFQVNNNFYWQADVVDTSPFIILDLGESREINGLGWVSEKDNHGLPRDYSISTSSDGKKWEQLKQISDNTAASRIDYFEPTSSRFVRMNVSSTALGQPPFLLEIEALDYADQIVSNFGSLVDLNNIAFEKSCSFILDDRQSYIPARITAYTDAGASTQYNQILRLNTSNDYYFDILQIEPRSGSRQLLVEQWSDVKVEIPGAYRAEWKVKEITE